MAGPAYSEHRVFLLLAGDTGVGKTMLARKMQRIALLRSGGGADEADPIKTEVTYGLEFILCEIPLPAERADVNCYFMDVPGNTNYMHYMSSMYRQASGVLFMYDVTRRATFDAVRTRWYDEMDRALAPAFVSGNRPPPLILLVANKMDTPPETHEVTAAEASALAAELGAHALFECSALQFRTSEQMAPIVHLVKALVARDRATVAQRETLRLEHPNARGGGGAGIDGGCC